MPTRTYNSEDPDVPNRLRYWRKKRGFTQEAFAELAGTTKQNIYRYETGLRPLTDRLMVEFAAILGIAPADLLPAEDPLTAEERELVNRYRAWDDATRAAHKGVMDAVEQFRPASGRRG